MATVWLLGPPDLSVRARFTQTVSTSWVGGVLQVGRIRSRPPPLTLTTMTITAMMTTAMEKLMTHVVMVMGAAEAAALPVTVVLVVVVVVVVRRRRAGGGPPEADVDCTERQQRGTCTRTYG